ncbi:hypothetical protein B484DRAFT_410660 [Ochromonadaceae sp. CCMP2298]|nr:hypothetical protein B484DRAFT_410660 [Ochromonadaceae sp. CCMP2298]
MLSVLRVLLAGLLLADGGPRAALSRSPARDADGCSGDLPCDSIPPDPALGPPLLVRGVAAQVKGCWGLPASLPAVLVGLRLSVLAPALPAVLVGLQLSVVALALLLVLARLVVLQVSA